MTIRRILLLTGRELTVHRFEGGRLRESFAFALDAAGQEGFGRYLAEHPGEATWLLLDLIEEEFRVEGMPHVSPMERGQLHARHAQRLFRTTPFRCATVLERSKEGRGDDRVLFSAVTNPDAVAPWLDRIAAAKVPLNGISSVAHASSALPRKLGLRDPHLLLVSEEEGAGLRQTFFQDGKLRVSRLSPVLHADTPRDYAALVDEEIGRTQRYLQRLQLLPAGAMLHVHVLIDKERGELLATGARPGNVRVEVVDLAAVCGRLDAPVPGNSFANLLFAALQARAGGNRYATGLHLRHRDLYRLRSAIAWGGMVAGVALLLLSASNTLQTFDHWRAAAATAQEVEHFRRLVSGQQLALPSGLDPERLRDAVESAETLSATNMQPGFAFTRLSRVLDDYPEFQITRLQWGASADPAFGDIAGGVEEGGLSLATESGVGDDAGPGLYHGLVVQGEVAPFKGDYREALDRFRALVEAARKMPQVAAVEVLTEPLDLRGRISGSVGTTAVAAPHAPFAFRVVFRL